MEEGKARQFQPVQKGLGANRGERKRKTKVLTTIGEKKDANRQKPGRKAKKEIVSGKHYPARNRSRPQKLMFWPVARECSKHGKNETIATGVPQAKDPGARYLA